ncbi:MAG: 1,6-anhydro-N-acetylmuramyl-L-alanine amidase AmpD [Gammaproteobacteria bacterium]|nr:1,6-anhydro-N-acetylmuramyl-L-alanine amidase AmpD [Gammaproteobacteria bacterium]
MNSTLTLNLQTCLLEPVPYRPSPYQDERPADVLIDMVVVHGISLPAGQFGNDNVENFFSGKLNTTSHPSFQAIATLRVSAHLLIKRSGDIIQFVSFGKRAWHAGESFFQGRTRCNDFSIGIELEGTDDVPYEQSQYHQLSNVIQLLKKSFPAITHDRIVGHADIAPGRKTDPGPSFDWKYLQGLLS